MTKYEPIFFDIETTGLNPMAQSWWDSHEHDARITAVGVCRMELGWRKEDDYNDVDKDVEIITNSSEYELLQDLSGCINRYINRIEKETGGREAFLVGFNSRKYDHPYLGARFARLRLPGPIFNHSRKRLDMMRAIGKSDVIGKRYPGQEDVAEELGVSVPDIYEGSDMPAAFSRGDWDAIRDHVNADVQEMVGIFFETADVCYKEFYSHYSDVIDGDYVNVEMA